MTRRCSHCSNNGHNSRTCPARGGGGVRLFGVRMTAAEDPNRVGSMAMKKSASMGSLSSFSSSSAAAAHAGGGSGGGSPSDPLRDRDHAAAGYASDDPTHASCSSSCRSDRKKGIPWTEEEHRMFLLGLQKLGKGDWRGIARNFVVSRTPTQVASHAQKYFIRQTNASRRKRRSSLFDMIPEVQMGHLPVLEEQLVLQSPPSEPENTNQLPSHPFCQDQDILATGPEPENPSTELKESIPFSNVPLPVVPTFFPAALIPMPFPFWPPTLAPPSREEEMGETHEVLKPTPVLPKDPINVDEVVGLSKLSIGEGVASRMEPSALSRKLLRDSATRQSAFHVNASVAGPELKPSNTNAIHAV